MRKQAIEKANGVDFFGLTKRLSVEAQGEEVDVNGRIWLCSSNEVSELESSDLSEVKSKASNTKL